jgi:para-aminobenzoate synthetase/4-amino-4-deoxychorismate lyase
VRFAVRTPEGDYCCCDNPERLIVANDAKSLREALSEIERLQSSGYYVAGWLSYEAAEALDAGLPVIHDGSFPMLAMMASREVEMKQLPVLTHLTSQNSPTPRIDRADYETRCQELLDYILAGDVYQANFSFRCDLNKVDDPFQLFCQLEAEHPMPHSAYIEIDDWQVLSLSPELFLARESDRIASEPMKGTAPRRLSFEDDEQERLVLSQDVKNCAENIMIVDLMRNDLGRICQIGSISVPFKLHPVRFHSLHQLISRVEGKLLPDVSLLEILKATFPAGSITGAPKVRAMEIVSELESDPRKVYTGSIGLFYPNGDFSLNVAIRTLTIEKKSNCAELGIGSGVVANSSRGMEWEECLLKSQFLNYRQLHREVFETILWRGKFVWLEEHLDRLEQSCRYWLIQFDRNKVAAELHDAASEFCAENYRVRLAVLTSGEIRIASSPMEALGWKSASLKLKLSSHRIDAKSAYQFHKTNVRYHYDKALAESVANGFDEVLFMNQDDELAEGAITNIFFRTRTGWMTPPVSCGLLPGIWRKYFAHLVEAKERVITQEDFESVEHIVVGNSLRGEGTVGEIWFNNVLIWQEAPYAAR